MDKPTEQFVPGQGVDQGDVPVSGCSARHPPGFQVPWHCHPTAQLIHTVQGVMVVSTDGAQWVVPPTRGVWIPPGVRHQMRMVGEVRSRMVYLRPEMVEKMPKQCQVVGISPLLRELILAATEVVTPCDPASRDGRVISLLLDELVMLPALPLSLPFPADPGLMAICRRLMDRPDDPSTLADWAQRFGVHVKTIERRFVRETGLTFGQWRQQARLTLALELLAKGEKIVDVALALGYGSPSAFATAFRQQHGVPPSAYRCLEDSVSRSQARSSSSRRAS